jgi:hypothetical protein
MLLINEIIEKKFRDWRAQYTLDLLACDEKKELLSVKTIWYS